MITHLADKPPLLGKRNLIEMILQQPNAFFWEIKTGLELHRKLTSMAGWSWGMLALYGLMLGVSHSPLQMVSSAIKLPLLFLLTLMIAVPTLYMMNLLTGVSQTFTQTLALVMTAITVTAAILVSFAPITLFYILTIPSAYQSFKLLNLLFFIIAMSSGVWFLFRGMMIVSGRRGVWLIGMWGGVYGLVGSQLAWTLRPFIGYPNAPFELFRHYGGNVYTNLWGSLGEILGFWVVQ